jgi:anti-sigma regulatory factor (Ser/Thr protein kinase)
LPDGRLAIVIGDVTDKGVPAALVMATTRAILRGAAGRFSTPGPVLESANDLLCPDIPPKMFVTCFYAILDPKTGKLQYANAGHDLPNVRTRNGVKELRAMGMPLGLMPGMGYEEKEIDLAVNDSVVFYSDGLVEAHNAQREMFGFPRFSQLVGEHAGGAKMIQFLLYELKKFVEPDWEQEDDVTLVTLQRLSAAEEWRTLARFSIPSEPGNERMAMQQVTDVITGIALDSSRVEKLKTAVAEATMNAIEHGNKNHAELDVHIDVRVSNNALAVRITDQGGEATIPEAQTPDLEAKLAGLQSPRGWGLFLIKNLVDEMNVTTDGPHHTVELVMQLKGGKNG